MRTLKPLIRLLRHVHHAKASNSFWLLAAIFLTGFAPLVNIVVPKYMLDELLGAARPAQLLFWLLVLVVGNLAFTSLKGLSESKIRLAWQAHLREMYQELSSKAQRLSIAEIESKSTLDLQERARRAFIESPTAEDFMILLLQFGSGLITVTSALLLLIHHDVRLLLFLLGLNAFSLPFLRKIVRLEEDNNARTLPEHRAYLYYVHSAQDAKAGKELRLTDGTQLFLNRAKASMDRILTINHQYFTKTGLLTGCMAAIAQLQTAGVFVALGIGLSKGLLSLGNFTLLANASGAFSSSMNRQLMSLSKLMACSLELSVFFHYMELPEMEELHAPSLKSKAQADKPLLAFEKVHFRYPSGSEAVLEDFSLTLHAGEKLALVGTNGAGKSTLIKLLCRFYPLDQGRILLEGRDIATLPLSELYAKLRVVFQQFKLFPFTLAENLHTRPEAGDRWREKINGLLEDAGIGDWVAQLPQGQNTPMSRVFSEEGAMPSGGIAQKLAIVRALFEESRLLILDEPTAALDPRSEEAVYEQFHRITEGKTALFISHRLSATRLADRIVVMDQGRIAEEGSHEALLQAQGLYAEMFAKQASYYALPRLQV